MNNLPDILIKDIEKINNYYKKYNINNTYFYTTTNKLKYIENFNLNKYGMYDYYNNKITVNPTKPDDGKKVLSHELLHIAGGFNSHIGFNEFSTQYLNTVIFNAKKGHFEKQDFKMIDRLVKIIGFDTFFKCYLLRDFNSFIKELTKHFEYSKAYTLINILDKYYSWFINLQSRQVIDKYELEKEFYKIIKKASFLDF